MQAPGGKEHPLRLRFVVMTVQERKSSKQTPECTRKSSPLFSPILIAMSASMKVIVEWRSRNDSEFLSDRRERFHSFFDVFDFVSRRHLNSDSGLFTRHDGEAEGNHIDPELE